MKGPPCTCEAPLLQVWLRYIGEMAPTFLFLISVVSPGVEIKESHLPSGYRPNSEIQVIGEMESARLTYKILFVHFGHFCLNGEKSP